MRPRFALLLLAAPCLSAIVATAQPQGKSCESLAQLALPDGKITSAEVVAAGAPIVTVLDLTDVYMTIFLPAADSGKLTVGDEARIVLDPVPDYVVPAKVSFVAADAQFTPKTVETKDERAKLMFRIKLKIDAQVLQQFYTRVKTGVRGLGFVRTRADLEWPAELQVKLPTPPADKASATPAPDNNAAETKTPALK